MLLLDWSENKDYWKETRMHMLFVKQGPPLGEKKNEKDLVRNELARVRSTAMEGLFGTQKEHYDSGGAGPGRSGRKSNRNDRKQI